MKKNIVIASSVLGSIALIGLVIGGIFWWKVLQDPQGPVFLDARGVLASGPTVVQSGDVYTITWSTTDNYPDNEVVMKSSISKYPDAGVGADIEFDSTKKVYVHTSRFRLSNTTKTSDINNVNEIENLVVVFAEGQYTYQVKSRGLAGKESVVSEVFPL